MFYFTSSRYRVRDFRVKRLSMFQILYCILLHYINTHTRKKIKDKITTYGNGRVIQARYEKTGGKALYCCVNGIKAAIQ